MENSLKEILQESVKELLAKMDFDCRVEVDFSQPEFLVIKIESEEAGLLIGQGGSTLSSLQHLVRAILNKKLDIQFSQKFIIDINNYRSHRLELLKEMALSWAKQVVEEKQARILQPMSAYERRVIHLTLSDFEGVVTESQGEEPARKVVIKPKEDAQAIIKGSSFLNAG